MISRNNDFLHFACECVSARGGYSDPWAGVAQNKLLPDGTKEEILNLVAREPMTIAQLADELGLARPSVHAHVGEMLASELLRESVEWEKKYPAERYYEPNFPVISAEDRKKLAVICDQMGQEFAKLFEKRCAQLEAAFGRTTLPERAWEFRDVAQYLYACVQRRGRELLEKRGLLPGAEKHRNGAKWIFWAEGKR
jgi:DNA-binding transcriptional ArsR family regulator